MNDDALQELLKRADERFQRRRSTVVENSGATAFVDAVRRQRARQMRRRTGLGVLAVLMMTAGMWAWSLNADFWRDGVVQTDAIASTAAIHLNGAPQSAAATEPTQDRRDEEIAKLKTELAALDAEAERAQRFVALYRAAEARRDRVAAAEAAALAEPLLPPQALAEMEIERAAGVIVVSADAQANRFHHLEKAAESYRSVLKYFPDSRWASVARERLDQIEGMN